jgi:uncharacterized protein (DUF2249 family)
MVIRGTDRVSTVLARDESLVDVFAELSPAFERLRNPMMRRVMARLVTIDQAARMGGVDAVTLLERLNAHSSSTPPRPAPGPDGAAAVPPSTGGAPRVSAFADNVPEAAPSPTRESIDHPAALARIAPEHIVTIDVRDELRAGREPFTLIMAAHRKVPEGGALCVRAIFEPVPLYAVMRRHNLVHFTMQRAADDWLVWFFPPDESDAARDATARRDADAAPADARSGEPDDGVVVLDVRGLEPPEPMLRTLAALEALPTGGTLVQVNVRVPQFLLPMLGERGYSYEIREQSTDLVRLFIRRAESAGD